MCQVDPGEVGVRPRPNGSFIRSSGLLGPNWGTQQTVDETEKAVQRLQKVSGSQGGTV